MEGNLNVLTWYIKMKCFALHRLVTYLFLFEQVLQESWSCGAFHPWTLGVKIHCRF